MQKFYAKPGESHQWVDYEEPETILMSGERPSLDHIAKADGTWEISKAGLKNQALKRMNETLVKGCIYKDVVYQCEERDVTQFSRGLTLVTLKGLETIECRALDNSMHTLTGAEYTELCGAVGLSFETALRTYWAEVDAID